MLDPGQTSDERVSDEQNEKAEYHRRSVETYHEARRYVEASFPPIAELGHSIEAAKELRA